MATSKRMDEELVEYGNSSQMSDNKKAHEFFMVLLQSALYVHILHLQTRSYAEHKALNNLYDELEDLADELIEAYQGRFGLVMEYPKEISIKANTNPVEFVRWLGMYIEDNRDAVSEYSEHQNIIDEIAALIDRTCYKLKFLS